MGLEDGIDQQGQLVWKFPDDTIVPVRIAIDSEGVLVPVPSGPGATEAKQDDVITELQTVRVIDADNSTIENLGNGGIFTGEWFDALGYASAVIHIFTNQDSAADGFQFQTSTDGTNPTHIHKFTVPSNTPNGTHYVFSLTGRYCRIIYTNGTNPQTSFNLSSTLSKYDITHSHTHPVEFSFDGNHETQLMRSVNAGKKPNGDYVNAEYTAGGNPKISIEEYDDAVNPIRKDMEGGGKIAVGTTAVEVVFAGTPTHSIIITADLLNTGVLYIGESNVTNAGANAMTFLEAGESLTMDYNDVDNAVYVVSDTVSQNFWKGALL